MPNRIICRSIFLLLPLLYSCQEEREMPTVEMKKQLNDWLDASGKSPRDSLTDRVKSGRSLIFAQNDILRKDSVILMESIAPIIHDLGIRRIALYFLDYRDQRAIDEYLNMSSDEDPASFLSFSNRALAFREYYAYLQYLRSYNESVENQEEHFEITAVGDSGNLSEKHLGDFLNQQELVFAWLLSSEISVLDTDGKLREDTEEESLARPVIIGHFGPGRESLAWKGLVEEVSKNRPLRDGSYSFDPNELPFNQWSQPMDFDADLLIVTGLPYQSVQPVKKIARPENMDKAVKAFPELSFRRRGWIAAARLNRAIKIAVKDYRKFLDRLTEEG